ncbi:CHAD domain-containing protein [Gemmatimonas groenlandica]|uniref:CHAD domain-containing protein n=1 Tax=Gemmatimonas groenlandica TaxID=2732249 RepID=A0A6M4IMT8_9BACT|nr:CHAD domain-containing protein [Gemmatimonas groenlandica]QJR34332.1 CHAD domain-containing protein [Gemmatimonas groenlandica]
MVDASLLTATDLRRLLPEALRRPAQEGARVVALHWLDQLCEARARWQPSAIVSADVLPPGEAALLAGAPVASADTAYGMEAETLHRARVSLRRLRAVLREHESALDGAVDRRTLRSLQALGQATNAVRDADVQRSWLDAETEQLPADARDEAMRLRAILDRRATRSTADVTRAFEKHLDPIVDRLLARLSTYLLMHRVGMPSTPTPFARHLATRVERASARLRRDLESVTSVESREAMHRVRIRLKRQRAMLAPFAKSRPALGAWYELATRGQDLLGAVRDADLLAERALKAKLPALHRALGAVALAHYEAFTLDWCARIDSVMKALELAVVELRRDSAPATESGVPLEIERKYLLTRVPPVAAAVTPTLIEQGWLPGTALRERLRRSTNPDGTVACWRNVKLGPAQARVEIDEGTSRELFDAMWPLTVAARVRKQRHVVRDQAYAWEIDVFLDRDLVLAEVELSGLDDRPALPEWLVPYVARDVTGEPAYFNSVLARADRAPR